MKSVKNLISIACYSIILLVLCTSPAIGANSLSVHATVLSNSTCSFGSGTSSLNFGALNPANSTDVTVTTPITFNCHGNWGNWFSNITFYISDDDGLHETGLNTPRMRNTTQPSEYLPYILDLDPASGTISFLGGWFGQTLKITGTVRANDYQKAYVGNYRDTVRITIVP